LAPLGFVISSELPGKGTRASAFGGPSPRAVLVSLPEYHALRHLKYLGDAAPEIGAKMITGITS